MERNGETVYKFGFGQSPFPVPSSLVETLKESAPVKDYIHSAGLMELRSVVADYYTFSKKHEVEKTQVIIGPGSKELLFLTQLSLKRPLVLPSPSWVSYAPQANYLGLETHWVDCKKANDYKLQAGALDQKLSELGEPALLILNSPNNPTGHVYTDHELKEIAQVAKKHNLIVISDEIYSLFTYNQGYPSISKHLPNQTIICSGLSKSHGAGGWRLGWMVFPKPLENKLSQLIELASETFSCVAAPIQLAAISAFKNPEVTDYLKKCNLVLKSIGSYVNENLTNKISSVKIEGGFYTMTTFNTNHSSSDQLCADLLEQTGVALLPGTAFGQTSGTLTARLAFVDFNGKDVLQLPNLHDINSNLNLPQFQKLKKGIHILNDWINAH